MSRNRQIEKIKAIAQEVGYTLLSKACGEYYAIQDNGESVLVGKYVGAYGYAYEPIEQLKDKEVQKIYNDLITDFGE